MTDRGIRVRDFGELGESGLLWRRKRKRGDGNGVGPTFLKFRGAERCLLCRGIANLQLARSLYSFFFNKRKRIRIPNRTESGDMDKLKGKSKSVNEYTVMNIIKEK